MEKFNVPYAVNIALWNLGHWGIVFIPRWFKVTEAVVSDGKKMFRVDAWDGCIYLRCFVGFIEGDYQSPNNYWFVLGARLRRVNGDLKVVLSELKYPEDLRVMWEGEKEVWVGDYHLDMESAGDFLDHQLVKLLKVPKGTIQK